MTDEPRRAGELSEEFRKLGSNLKEALRAAWYSPEREQLEEEIRSGLHQAAEALADLAEGAVESEPGKKLRGGLESLGDRVRSGALEARVREDLLEALQRLNAELERARARRHDQESAPPDEPPAGA